MDGSMIAEPRRFSVPISNRFGSGEMSVLEFGPADRPVDLVFLHANGFNAYTYRSLLTTLGQGLRIWAPDLRGHGHTTLPTVVKGRRNWHDHRDDLIALLDKVDAPSVMVCGHSIGGTTALLAAEKLQSRIRQLLLLDPVIWPPLTTAAFGVPVLSRIPTQVPIVKSTLRRRDVFEARDQAFASWQGRGAFKGWPDDVLRDYLTGGLLPAADGFKLACTPAWEASNYSAQAHNPWRALRRYRGPITILKAQAGSLCAVTPRPGVDVRTVKGGGHLFPMTHANVVIEAVHELV